MPDSYKVAMAAFGLKWGSSRPQKCIDRHSLACHVVHKPPQVLCKAQSPLASRKPLTCITPSSSPLWIPALPTGGQGPLSRCKICPSFHHFMACLFCRIWIHSLANQGCVGFGVLPPCLWSISKTRGNQRVRCPHKSQQDLQLKVCNRAHNTRHPVKGSIRYCCYFGSESSNNHIGKCCALKWCNFLLELAWVQSQANPAPGDATLWHEQDQHGL